MPLLLHIGHLIKMPPVFASVVWGFRHVILGGGLAETWEKPWRDWISWLVWESLSVPHQKSEVTAKVSLLILISIFYWVSRFGSEQRNPHFPHPRHLFQLICGDTELLPSHPRDIISSAGPGFEQEPHRHLGGTLVRCPEIQTRISVRKWINFRALK